MKKIFYTFFLILVGFSQCVHAQKAALKTNLFYDATATANLGLEVALAPKWTLDISANVNAWRMPEDRRWKHWLVQPEVRYWFCDRFSGHFIAIQVHGGQFNFGNLPNNIRFLGIDYSLLTDHRFEGWMAGAGVAYGYDWILGRHWNLEAEIGIGYAYTVADQYRCADCGKRIAEDIVNHYFGLTRAAISIVYVF